MNRAERILKGLSRRKRQGTFGFRKWKDFDSQIQILMTHYRVDEQTAVIRVLINEKLMQIENSKQIGG
ncbi:hypothetical protein [Flavobacterium filum]|uniref:hypothetical protein n=1 Tax=Flavobacterium filum TaxID=370974 RepID=UPI0023F50B1C|nr:hypothetical protein [Flavobacterium filum]